MTALDKRFASYGAAWRDPLEVVAGSAELADREALRYSVRGAFWDVLAQLRITLLVTREYEHIVLSLSAPRGLPTLNHILLPHPSGICYDPARKCVYVAATRNPTQLVSLEPVTGMRDGSPTPTGRPLAPRTSRFLPGRLYLHDLAMIDKTLHANAVGENAVVSFSDPVGSPTRVWWPKSIERRGKPDFSQNYLQLNSIAAGRNLASSYFTASSEQPSSRRPGHLNYPVDRRGVVFSGATREVVARGLTRPHSARFHGDDLWVDDSGYGALGRVVDGGLETACILPGWTRGLCFVDGFAFVGTSRVIPRFRRYAPGLDPEKAVCGVHIVDVRRGLVTGSIRWPSGNQIFGIEAVPLAFSHGFVRHNELTRTFYSFDQGDDT